MSQAPSMPMYWDAYLADTTHLTTEEHGAYLLLLAAMWRRNGTVPDDDKDNARILGLTKAKWLKVKARLSDALIFENNHISQKKLQKTWKKTQEIIQKNRVNGAKGGRPVSIKNNDLGKAVGSVSHNPNVTIPEPELHIKVLSKDSTQKTTKGKINGHRIEAEFKEDWGLPEEYNSYAIGKGITDIGTEFEKFCNFWRAKSGKDAIKRDWLATWRNWCINAAKWEKNHNSRGNGGGGQTSFIDIANELIAECDSGDARPHDEPIRRSTGLQITKDIAR